MVAIMSERLVAIVSEQVVGIIPEYLVGIIGIRNKVAEVLDISNEKWPPGRSVCLRLGFTLSPEITVTVAKMPEED